MLAFQVALLLPLARAHCHACALVDGCHDVEVSLVQRRSEAIRRGTSPIADARANLSQALGARDGGRGQDLPEQVALARALSQGVPQQEPPEQELAFGLPAAVTEVAAAGGEQGSRGLGIVAMMLVMVLLASCLVYLVLSHESKKGSRGSGPAAPDKALAGSTVAGAGPQATGGYSRSGSEQRWLEARPMDSSRELQEDAAELPRIYPNLVMPCSRTRLAIPLEPLSQREFEIDVLGLSGAPLLTAALDSRSGARTVRLALHGLGTPLARATPELRLLGPGGARFGRLAKDGTASKYVLCDPGGQRTLLTIVLGKDPHEMRMVTEHVGHATERATVVRRPATRLPAEHYELTVSPGVDAVLVLACFLALEVFALPRSSAATWGGSIFG